MHRWLLQKYISLIQRWEPDVLDLVSSELVSSEYEGLPERKRRAFRRSAKYLSVGFALASMLNVLFLFVFLALGSAYIFLNFDAEQTMKFGTIWISVSIVTIFFDLSPVPFLAVKDVRDQTILPNEIADEAIRVHVKLKPIHDILRRGLEIFMLIFGTLLTGYGDILHIKLAECLGQM